MNDIDKIIQTSYKNLDKMLDNTLKKGYFFKYGFDLIISIIVILIFSIVIIFLYFYTSNKLSKNKYTLSNDKCNPMNIPFMDILNYNNKTTFLDKSTANFNYCVQNALKPVVENTIKPHNESLNIIRKTYDDLNTSTNGITSIINNVRNNVTNNTNDIYNRIKTTTQEQDKLLKGHKNILYKSNDKINSSFNVSQNLNKTLIKLSKTLGPLKIMGRPSWIK
tara:strand:- start:1596 stop:2258 length:663 start_codon:yes stop_codon:yes gene_type:complete